MSQLEVQDSESLGGDDQSIDYHPLALDSQASGVWGAIDRIGDRVAGWLNPILIKEARQSLKSRQFITTFFLLLVASCIWTVLGIVSNAPDVYYVPSGDTLLGGYYFVLAIPLMFMVPLAAHRSLAAEIDDDTFEMLVITKLSAMRIVMGKLNSAMLQMMVYFAAIVPCLAFSYLLRGVTLQTIAMLIGTVFFTATLLTTFSLMLATLAPNRAGQTLALIVVIGVLLFGEFMCAAFCLDVVLMDRMGDQIDAVIFSIVFLVIGGSCMAMFIRAAAARIAPVTENRSTGLRWTMFLQQLLWIGSITFLVLWYEEGEVLNFGTMILGGYWLVMGTLMLSESPELSPRVQRTLPSTLAGRSVLTWFNPGPGTGYVFAISTGCVAAMVMGAFGILNNLDDPRTDTMTFSVVIMGYLLGYLGVVRLIVLLINRRFGPNLIIPLSTLAAVMGLAAFSPLILTVIFTGNAPNNYTSLEAIDWAWTMVECFENQYDPVLALVIFVFGVAVTLINLGLLFREFTYQRVSIPKRVLAENEA